jgi:hypothetical protein
MVDLSRIPMALPPLIYEDMAQKPQVPHRPSRRALYHHSFASYLNSYCCLSFYSSLFSLGKPGLGHVHSGTFGSGIYSNALVDTVPSQLP